MLSPSIPLLPAKGETAASLRPVWKWILIPWIAIFGIGSIVFLSWLFRPLPEAEVPIASSVFDHQGRLVATLAIQNRIYIPLQNMAPELRAAVVATEDGRFFRHFGLDPVGIARAAYRNLRAGKVLEGGSTITSQLARNLYLTQDRTWIRKLEEALLSLKLEIHLEKEEILETYLNLIYFGHGAYGVEAAARTYFGKSARDLDVGESAMLAGIIRSPGSYSPFRYPERASERQAYVLQRMVEAGYLSEEEAEAARNRPVHTMDPQDSPSGSPYFVDYVRHILRERLPEVEAELERGGYRIYTTLDLDMQKAAELAFRRTLIKPNRIDEHGIAQPQAALVALDPNHGHIRALIGGRDFQSTQFNRAFQARRQPGSAFKPFLYTALIDRGIPLTAVQPSMEAEYPGQDRGETYRPRNFEHSPYRNQYLTLRQAVAVSDNLVAVRWAHEIGPREIVRYAHRMGIPEEVELEPTLPLALGASGVTPLELAVAYAPLANLGRRVEPVAVLRVESRQGRVLYEQTSRTVPVLDAATAFLMTDLLRSVLEEPYGTGHSLREIFSRPAAGKTGTSNAFRNAWFVGYTPDLVTVVYIGDDDHRPLPGTGGSLAGPVWADFMAEALKGQPVTTWPRPPDVFLARTCVVTGSVGSPVIRDTEEWFRTGMDPELSCREGITSQPKRDDPIPIDLDEEEIDEEEDVEKENMEEENDETDEEFDREAFEGEEQVEKEEGEEVKFP